MQASIILPTYNEADNIGPLITAIDQALCANGWEGEIVVVDDNSPDGTAQAAQACQEKIHCALFCLVRTQERGLATAIRHGIEHSSGERVLVMDTDFNHAPEMLPAMLSMLDEADMVIGSRFVKGGGMEDRQRNRNSWAFNVFLRLLLWTPIHDNLSGFFAMRGDKLRSLPLEFIFRGYGEYFIRLLYLARLLGDRMREIPVFYKLRQHGSSKSDFTAMIWDYTRCAVELKVKQNVYL